MNTFTKSEKNWILYDVGNSAYILFLTAVLPIVFNSLAKESITESQYFAYWGYGLTLATLIVGILGPILGSISDHKNMRKRLFVGTVILGILAFVILPFLKNWVSFLVLVVISKIGFSTSLILYDSMLADICEDKEKIDKVSSHGYAWGYIGSTIPFVVSIVVMMFGDKVGLDTKNGILLSFLCIAAWWFIFSLPLIKSYKQLHYHEDKAIKVFTKIKTTIKEIRKNKKVLLFLLAFIFYIDGVYTIINMATAYGKSLGLDTNGLIMAFLMTQIIAFPAAILFGIFAKKYRTETLIKVCIVAYTLIATYAIQLDQLYEFWILAFAVGIFQGGVQALSRSYFVKIIPINKSGEYFGIFDICGKGADIIGTLLISLITSVTRNQSFAVFSLTILFVIGLVLFHIATRVETNE